MIFGCAAMSRLRASSSALKLSSLHICGATALWRRKMVGSCLTRCNRASCGTGAAEHSHPVTVDKSMQKSAIVHAATILSVCSPANRWAGGILRG